MPTTKGSSAVPLCFSPDAPGPACALVVLPLGPGALEPPEPPAPEGSVFEQPTAKKEKTDRPVAKATKLLRCVTIDLFVFEK